MSRKLAKQTLRILIIALALAIFTYLPAGAAAIKTTQKLIMIDPGHGGEEDGIKSAAGLLEKQITLKLARLIQKKLASRYLCRLTRTSDTLISPENRAALANRRKADLFISLHLHTRHPGTSYFYYFDIPKNPEDSDMAQWKTRALAHTKKSKAAAVSLANIFKKNIPDNSTRIIPAAVIQLKGLSMPGILMEPFAASQVPSPKAEQDMFLEPYALSLAQGIEAFLKKTTP